ncbi:RNA polymerase sigma factor [Pedobacter sp. MC2016-24]|uniref:RNA polymerase sigma factor n=1 Tax=Pedobacter sp. MC2016-24 TaxID=2780090 RepID=UPI001882E56A|nr:RNA polymerase sigma-70 factor [Pedobacter sp. MC2016-24]MBE9601570.1 RNA polymerase sigma-70 factor [Pedobacter sp. MC2016-24]
MELFNKLSDSEILSHLKLGNHDVFHMVYEFYHKKVYAVALKILKQPLDAEEVMQEVLLKLWLSAPKLREESNLEAYLKTLAKNACYNLLRRQLLEAKVSALNKFDFNESHNNTEEHILLMDARRVLQDAINQLPPQQKKIYELCHQQGLKYDEVASQLNISHNTVQTYMKLALRTVRNYVRSHTHLYVLIILFGLLEK